MAHNEWTLQRFGPSPFIISPLHRCGTKISVSRNYSLALLYPRCIISTQIFLDNLSPQWWRCMGFRLLLFAKSVAPDLSSLYPLVWAKFFPLVCKLGWTDNRIQKSKLSRDPQFVPKNRRAVIARAFLSKKPFGRASSQLSVGFLSLPISPHERKWGRVTSQEKWQHLSLQQTDICLRSRDKDVFTTRSKEGNSVGFWHKRAVL